MNRLGFFAAAQGAVDRAVFDSALELEDTGDGNQSQAITIPADCELVVVLFASRAASAAMGTHTVTLGGASPDYTPLPWTQNTSRNGVAIYGFLTANTGVGSQTWVSSFSGNAGIGSQVEFFFFSAGNYNPDLPFLPGELTEVSSSGDPISVTYTPLSSKPLILAQCSQSQSSGSLTGYTGTNLTIQDFLDDSNTFYGCGYNDVLDGAGSTTFTLNATGPAVSYASMSLVEMPPPGWIYPVGIYHKGHSVNTGNATSYTFSNIDIGPEFPGRVVVAAAFIGNGGSTTVFTVTSATIGGLNAPVFDTAGIDDNGAGNSMSWGLFGTNGVSGSTASITFNLSGTPSNVSLGVYVLSGVPNPEPVEVVRDDTVNPLLFQLASHDAISYGIGGACSFGGSSLTVSSNGTPQPTYDGGATQETSRFAGEFSMENCSSSPQLSCTINSASYDECGFFAVWDANPIPFGASLKGSYESAVNASSYTYSSAPLGFLANGRGILVAVTAGGASQDISGVTLGGVSMTQIANQTTPDANLGLFYLDEDVSLSADVVVSISGGSAFRCTIDVIALYGHNPTWVDTDNVYNTSGTTNAVTLDIPANGLSVHVIATNGTTTTSWSSASEILEDTSIAGETGSRAIAVKTVVSETLGHTETATISGSAQNGQLAVSFAPA